MSIFPFFLIFNKEDTFILLDALEQDLDWFRTSKPRVALEIGSGSGCVSAFLGSILGSSCLYISTDINAQACKATARTGSENKIVIDTLNTSFASPLSTRLRQKIDVIIFNPPYVSTSSQEALDAQATHGIDAALSGGTDGMEVTNTFLQEVKNYLSDTGHFYLVAVKSNNIDDICARMSQLDLSGQVILQRRAGIENLSVIRFQKVC